MMRNFPLRKKLIIISIISSGIALVATFIAIVILEVNTHKPKVIRSVESLADLYSATLPATISFDDPRAANENLSTMNIQHEIRQACVYKTDGTVFASYKRSSENQVHCPVAFSRASEFFFEGAYLQVFRKIIYSGEVLGHLFIQYEMPPLLVRLLHYGAVLIVIFLSLLFTSLLFILGFEKKVIRPILRLETVAREISSGKNYKLRAQKSGQDEIGALTDEFNHMLNSLDESLTALLKSESKFRRVSESNMIGIIFVNIYGEILEANDYFLEMLGYTREDLVNKRINWSELTPPEYQYPSQKAIDELIKHDVYRPFEKEYFRKDGSRVSVLLGGAFLKDSKTDIVDFVLDITERKRVEVENVKLLKEEHEARMLAEDALQLREDFMSIAAHELRTPLMPLRLQLGVMKNEFKKNIEYPKSTLFLKYISSSEEQINRLNRLIDDMLDVAHIRTGRLTLNLETVDVTELVHSVIDRYQTELKKIGVELKISIKSHLHAFWDRLRIEQVLINLLNNAVKYGEKKPIIITVDSDGGNAVITVQDFGIGISEADQQRIFNRFERAVSIHNYGGFGLGLYIAKQIVESHNGHIKLQSAPGAGSSFIVEIPLRSIDT